MYVCSTPFATILPFNEKKRTMKGDQHIANSIFQEFVEYKNSHTAPPPHLTNKSSQLHCNIKLN